MSRIRRRGGLVVFLVLLGLWGFVRMGTLGVDTSKAWGDESILVETEFTLLLFLDSAIKGIVGSVTRSVLEDERPIGYEDTFEVPAGENVVLDVLANDSDVDSDTLYIREILDIRHGWAELTQDKRRIVYRAPEGFSGRDNFAYVVTDTGGKEAQTTVELIVVEPTSAVLGEWRQNFTSDQWYHIQASLMLLDYLPQSSFFTGPNPIIRGALGDWQEYNHFSVTGYLTKEQYDILTNDACSSRPFKRWRDDTRIDFVLFSPGDEYILTSGDYLRLYDTRDFRRVVERENLSDIVVSTFSPDGGLLVTGGEDSVVRLYEVEGWEERFEWGHDGVVVSLSFSPDGGSILTGSSDGTARLFDTRSGELLHTLEHGDGVWTAVFSWDGRYILTGSKDKTARLFDRDSGKELYKWESTEPIVFVGFSHDDRFIFTGGVDHIARLYDTESGELVHAWIQGGIVWRGVFTQEDSHILTVSADQTVRVYDLSTGEERFRRFYAQEINDLRLSPDGRYALVGTKKSTITLYDIQEGVVVHSWKHNIFNEALRFSHRGKQALVAGQDGIIRIFPLFFSGTLCYHEDGEVRE